MLPKAIEHSFKDHATNEEVCRKIQAAIGEYDELLALVKKRKLRWFGHVSRSSGLAKTILQGTVKGKRGRQKKGGKTISNSGQELTLPGQLHGGESRDLSDGVHGISCQYLDKTSKENITLL